MGRTEKPSYPQGRLQACEASVQEAAARKTAAAKAQASAEEKLSAARAMLDEAAARYLKEPSESNAALVHRARDEVHLRELFLGQAQREVATAADAETTAGRARVDAQAEVAADERAKRVEQLLSASSDEAIERAMVPLVASLFEGHKIVKQAAQGLDDLYAASCSAAEELRQLGEPVTDVGPHKVVKPIVEHLIRSNPATAVSILGAIDCGRWGMFAPGGAERPIGKTVAPNFRNTILDGDWFGRAEHTGSEQERAIAELKAFFGARTVREGLDARRAEQMKPDASDEPAPAAPAPAPPQPLGKTVLKIFSGATGEMTEIRK
jgi:hypothetical protein